MDFLLKALAKHRWACRSSHLFWECPRGPGWCLQGVRGWAKYACEPRSPVWPELYQPAPSPQQRPQLAQGCSPGRLAKHFPNQQLHVSVSAAVERVTAHACFAPPGSDRSRGGKTRRARQAHSFLEAGSRALTGLLGCQQPVEGTLLLSVLTSFSASLLTALAFLAS